MSGNTLDERGIFLVGMMGCGKSTLGKQIARRLRRPFLDSDTEIEIRAGVGIPLIFEIEGEARFREREREVLQELARRPGIVLATGGGAVLHKDNRIALRENGIVVYLHAAVDVLHARTRTSRSRPLLQVADPETRLREIYAQRDPLYRETAHVIVESGQGRMADMTHRILAEIARIERAPLHGRPN